MCRNPSQSFAYLDKMNPFMAFCLYVAARVFVQYLKTVPHDHQTRTALQFLLTAMEAMKLKNPLTESFLVQLHLDIKGNGLDIFFHNPDYSSIYMDGKVSLYRFPYLSSYPLACRPLICLRIQTGDSIMASLAIMNSKLQLAPFTLNAVRAVRLGYTSQNLHPQKAPDPQKTHACPDIGTTSAIILKPRVQPSIQENPPPPKV